MVSSFGHRKISNICVVLTFISGQATLLPGHRLPGLAMAPPTAPLLPLRSASVPRRQRQLDWHSHALPLRHLRQYLLVSCGGLPGCVRASLVFLSAVSAACHGGWTSSATASALRCSTQPCVEAALLRQVKPCLLCLSSGSLRVQLASGSSHPAACIPQLAFGSRTWRLASRSSPAARSPHLAARSARTRQEDPS